MSTEEDRPEELTDELARKYDPERMLRMVSKRAGKGEALDHHLRNKYERHFGVDLSHVRVYTGEFAEEFNKQRNAHAVTIGSTGMILMGGTEKSSGSSGQALLAHELTHVAQQAKAAGGGLHRKSSFSGGMPFAEEHEAEAEAVEAQINAEHGGANSIQGDAATHARVNALANQQAEREALAKAIEQIRERVYEMVAETERNRMMRNGSQRRA